MNNFIFQNPVKLIMGRGMIAQLSKEIPSDKRIMITFGGGSVKKNGVYDQVKEALKDYFTVEFWGIEPNPAIETLRKAIALGKEHKVDYLLAVGGGSVIDGTKLNKANFPLNACPKAPRVAHHIQAKIQPLNADFPIQPSLPAFL